MKNTVVLLLGMWILSGCTTTNNIEFPVVEKNVAYSKVASLGFVNANEKIHYGSGESQFALLWRATHAEQTKSKPLVVLLHGGCWLSAYDI